MASSSGTLERERERYYQLTECFLLGEYLQAKNFKNSI
jgi:hypothetical protein